MHHYRGKLLDGDRIRLDPANIFVQYNGHAGAPDAGWYGYLLIGSAGDLEIGNTYVLELEDGRSGTLRIDEVNPEGNGKFRALFVGEGSLA